MTGSDRGGFRWRRVTEADFPLLGEWLAQPHVARWWNHEFSAAAVERDFGPAARGEEPSEDLLALLADGRPVALFQRCRLADYPDYLAELSSVTEVPDGTVTLDYLIGPPELTGQGLGPRLVRSAVTAVWTDHPGAPTVLIPVPRANRRSWRALEKAGLRRVGEGELEPDNPVDDRIHYLYRVDRAPSGGAVA